VGKSCVGSCVGEPTSVAFLKQIAARSVRVRWYLALQSRGSNSAESFMGFLKHTVGISRADLTRDCLQQTRCWPGCETVESVGVLGEVGDGFSVRVIDYGMANKKLADRAIRCVEREKLRRYHLKPG
jgi:hypothetical protein